MAVGCIQRTLTRLKDAAHALHQLKSEHQYLGRYSVDKLCAFHKYQETASVFRVVAVIVLTPVPTLLSLVLLDSMELRDPRRSVDQHATTFLRSAFSHSLMTYVILLALKQAMGFTALNSSYTHARCLLIGVCVAVTNEAIWTTLAFTWKFPVPMRELLAVPPWSILCVVYHFILAKDDFAREFHRLKRYMPVVTAQLVLFYFLLGLSIVFAKIPYTAQLGMIFLFPAVNFSIKHQLWKFSRRLDDISADVTICMVEISSSLYQTLCLQYVHTGFMVAVIMLLDLLQAMVEFKTYMTHEYAGDTRSTLETSFKINATNSDSRGVPIDNIVVKRRDQARILEQTLQLLFAAEVLLFVEYMEVFMPMLYAACIGTLWGLPNAKYNVILNQLTYSQVVMEVGTSTVYAGLELLSFLSVYWFVKKRYGISALYQLAFLLETYWMTLQGKLIGCFITILNSSTIHQGIDLSFRSNVTAQLQGVPLGD